MADWNEQSAPNNNLQSETLKSSKIIGKKDLSNHQFSEELSDGGERDEIARKAVKTSSTWNGLKKRQCFY